jgi:hypothetical protein
LAREAGRCRRLAVVALSRLDEKYLSRAFCIQPDAMSLSHSD